MEKPEPFKADTHRNRRDQKLLGERPREMLHNLIVPSLVECSNRRRDLFFRVAWHHDPILPAKDARMVITERVAPYLHDQFARHQQTRRIQVRLQFDPLLGLARSADDGRSRRVPE